MDFRLPRAFSLFEPDVWFVVHRQQANDKHRRHLISGKSVAALRLDRILHSPRITTTNWVLARGSDFQISYINTQFIKAQRLSRKYNHHLSTNTYPMRCRVFLDPIHSYFQYCSGSSWVSKFGNGLTGRRILKYLTLYYRQSKHVNSPCHNVVGWEGFVCVGRHGQAASSRSVAIANRIEARTAFKFGFQV